MRQSDGAEDETDLTFLQFPFHRDPTNETSAKTRMGVIRDGCRGKLLFAFKSLVPF